MLKYCASCGRRMEAGQGYEWNGAIYCGSGCVNAAPRPGKIRCDICGEKITGTIYFVGEQLVCKFCFKERHKKQPESPTAEKSRAEQLAEAHWQYIEQTIRMEYDGTEDEFKDFIDLESYLRRVGWHYRTAMIHGYGHGIEDSINKAKGGE